MRQVPPSENKPIKSVEDVAAFISEKPEMLRTIRLVETLSLPDCWIAAGFIRNAVWDALHDRPYAESVGDVDVVFFDPLEASPKRDGALEKNLRFLASEFAWSVKNQARMHIGNGDAPYENTADAMTHWPETCTAIGARTRQGQIEILAPFGVEDLLALRVRPTPAFQTKMSIYRDRLAIKAWHVVWPQLDIQYS